MNIPTTLRRPWARLLLVAATLAATLLPVQAAVFSDGFEAGLWTGAGFSRDTAERHAGRYAAKVTGTAAEQSLTSAAITINPNDAHRVSVWVRSALRDSAPVVSLGIQQFRADGSPLGWAPGGAARAFETGGTQPWARYTATLPRLHSATATVKLVLRLDRNAAGSVWFDDVSIASVNLLANPGFETAPWTASPSGGWTRDTVERHGGSYAAKVVAGSTERFVNSAAVPVQDVRQYLLSAWIKTAGVTPATAASVSVLQVNASNQALGWIKIDNDQKLVSTGGTKDWTHFTAALPPLLPGTTQLKVYLRSDAASAGTAWFDDLVLTPVYRDNFRWGVNAHTAINNPEVYPRIQLEAQLVKAQNLGGTLYRVNLTPPYDAATGQHQWDYLDQMIEAAHLRGQQVCLVLFDVKDDARYGSPAVFAARAREIAAKYRGKIAYYQVGNELDNWVIRGKEFDGSQSSHYEPADYATARNWLRAVFDGIRQGDPHAKRMLNIAWKHTGFLEMLKADGLQWEVNALDWYQELNIMQQVLKKLQSYEQQEILIAEFNIRYGTQQASEEAQRRFIEQGAHEVYYRSPSKVKGFLVYELLDEGNARTDDERHYGLVRYTRGASGQPGVIGPDKAAYGGFKALIEAMPD